MRKRIFIVEDDANILYSLKAKLAIVGFDVEVNIGTSQIDIIKEITAFKPDLIVLDLILPKIDGFEVLKDLKSSTETKNVPVFIFTNLSDEDSRTRGGELGCDLYFLKNLLNIDEFVNKIIKIFKNKEKLAKLN
jgi:DNA-binding response OmpR family regulator